MSNVEGGASGDILAAVNAKHGSSAYGGVGTVSVGGDDHHEVWLVMRT
jgi:hypothetical protein